jgi:hypothetical protein
MPADARGAWLLLLSGAAVIAVTLIILHTARVTGMPSVWNTEAQHAVIVRH